MTSQHGGWYPHEGPEGYQEIVTLGVFRSRRHRGVGGNLEKFWVKRLTQKTGESPVSHVPRGTQAPETAAWSRTEETADP